MPHQHITSSPQPLTVATICLAQFTVLIACFVRLASGGWSTLSLFIPNAAVILCHAIILSFAGLYRPTRVVFAFSLFSSVLLLLGIALQRDFGDGQGSWLVYMAMVQPNIGDTGRIPNWWPLHGDSNVDLLLYVPLAVSWLVVLMLATWPTQHNN